MAEAEITPQTTDPGVTAEPPPAMPAPDAAPYQTLSLIAVAGFALAMLVAVMVLLGGLVPFASGRPGVFWALLAVSPVAGVVVGAAVRGRRQGVLAAGAGAGLLAFLVLGGFIALLVYAGSNPWLLSGWFWALAAAAIVTCLIARAVIAGSEGTLAGEWYARTGLYTTLFVGLIYGAYQTSVHLAITSQARAAALDFVEKLKARELVQAFLLTLPPSQRGVEESAVRNLVETWKLEGPPNTSGPFATFCRSKAARLLGLLGEDAVVEEVGLTTSLSGRQYDALVHFRVKGGLFSFDLKVPLRGIEANVGGVTQRAWEVLRGQKGMIEDVVASDRANALSRSWKAASRLGTEFLNNLSGQGPALSRSPNRAFQYTLPMEERSLADVDRPKRTKQYADFIRGDWGKTRDAWAISAVGREDSERGLRRLFDPAAPPFLGNIVPIARAEYLNYRLSEDGKKITVEVDVQAIVRDGPTEPSGHTIEGVLLVEGPLTDGEVEALKYRVVGFRWDRIKKFQPGGDQK
jgi:hypothetical protein